MCLFSLLPSECCLQRFSNILRDQLIFSFTFDWVFLYLIRIDGKKNVKSPQISQCKRVCVCVWGRTKADEFNATNVPLFSTENTVSAHLYGVIDFNCKYERKSKTKTKFKKKINIQAKERERITGIPSYVR